MNPTPAPDSAASAWQELSDEELDTWILTRLRMAGVDLSVLPEDDEDAPADRRRVLASARRFLRRTPPALLALDLDPQKLPPLAYPALWVGRTGRGGEV